MTYRITESINNKRVQHTQGASTFFTIADPDSLDLNCVSLLHQRQVIAPHISLHWAILFYLRGVFSAQAD